MEKIMTTDTIGEFVRGKNRLTSAYFFSGAVTVFLPVIMMTVARASNDYDDENGDNNNGDNNGDGDEDEFKTPWWYFGGGRNEDRRERETPPVLIATYLWSILVFGGLLFYGYHTIRSGADLNPVVAALVLFANYNVLCMFLIGGVEGAIETEGKEIEEDGFVGQFGVMMYITSIFWTIFSIVFALIFRHKAKHINVTKIEVEPMEYHVHDPETQYGDKNTV